MILNGLEWFISGVFGGFSSGLPVGLEQCDSISQLFDRDDSNLKRIQSLFCSDFTVTQDMWLCSSLPLRSLYSACFSVTHIPEPFLDVSCMKQNENRAKTWYPSNTRSKRSLKKLGTIPYLEPNLLKSSISRTSFTPSR